MLVFPALSLIVKLKAAVLVLEEYVVEYVDNTDEVRKELVAAPDDYAARNIIEEMLAGDGEVLSVDVATEEDKSKFYHQATQYEYQEDITLPFM